MNSQFARLNLKDLGHALLAGGIVSIIPVLQILVKMLEGKETIDLGVLVSTFMTAFVGWLGTKFFINENGALGKAK